MIPPDSTSDAPRDPDATRPPFPDEDDPRAQQRRARLDVVFRTYYVALVQYACTLGRHELTDAEDAVGDVFFTLHTARGELLDPLAPGDDPEKLPSYLYGSVKGRMQNRRRNEHTRDTYHDQADIRARPTQIPPPDQILEHTELFEHYTAALQQLSPRQRQIYLLIRQDGYTFAEVAAKLKISTQAAKTHFQRATDKLRGLLAQWL